MKGLENKVTIIMGSTMSIVTVVTEKFAAEGVKVIIADIAVYEGQALAEKVGSNAYFSQIYVTSDDDLKKTGDLTVEKYSRLDFIVNIACTYLDNGMESSREEFLQSFNINAASCFKLSQFARPHPKKSKGAIINFGSISAKVATIGGCLNSLCFLATKRERLTMPVSVE